MVRRNKIELFASWSPNCERYTLGYEFKSFGLRARPYLKSAGFIENESLSCIKERGIVTVRLLRRQRGPTIADNRTSFILGHRWNPFTVSVLKVKTNRACLRGDQRWKPQVIASAVKHYRLEEQRLADFDLVGIGFDEKDRVAVRPVRTLIVSSDRTHEDE